MNNENKNKNPFIVGDWIKRDEDFYGRTELIQKYLALQRSCYWLIGARRMGKTSLLRYLQRQYRQQPGLLPLFWDVAGANSAFDLKLSLLDCLEASSSDFMKNGIAPDYEKLEDESVFEILRWLIRVTNQKTVKTVLLIDESEAIFRVATHDPQFIDRFKAILFNHHNFHIILASNHGLAHYDPLDTTHFAAPLLQAFLPADYLTPWNPDDARIFINRCIADESTQNRIIEYTGCLPFLLQMACFHIFELENLEQALDKIKNDGILDLFFRNDFQNFDRNDTLILATVFKNEPVALERIKRLMENNFNHLESRLATLTWLGFLTQDKMLSFRLNNAFLRHWMEQHFIPAFQEKYVIQNTFPTNGNKKLIIRFNNGHAHFLLLENDVTVNEIKVPIQTELLQYRQIPADFLSLKRAGQQFFQILFDNLEVQQIYQNFKTDRMRGEISICNCQKEINSIPFEMLHDEQQFLFLQFPFYRRHSENENILQNKISLPETLNILLVASNTAPSIPYVDNEIILLKSQFEKIARELNLNMEITSLLSHEATYSQVMNLLDSTNWHLIHYAGHGGQDADSSSGFLYLRETLQKKGPVKIVDIHEISEKLNHNLLLFYLNSCNSGRDLANINLSGFADTVLARGPQAFIGNTTVIEDRLSAEFAMDFYWYLFENQFDFAMALYLTRLKWSQQTQFMADGHFFWFSPVLWQNF